MKTMTTMKNIFLHSWDKYVCHDDMIAANMLCLTQLYESKNFHSCLQFVALDMIRKLNSFILDVWVKEKLKFQSIE